MKESKLPSTGSKKLTNHSSDKTDRLEKENPFVNSSGRDFFFFGLYKLRALTISHPQSLN